MPKPMDMRFKLVTLNQIFFIEGSSGSEQPLFSIKLFYYKKGETTYGIPDNRTNTGLPKTSILKDIKVYPNPTTEFLNIQVQEPISVLVIGIFNSFGKKILTKKITNGDTIIDVSKLIPGIYLITCTTEYEIKNLKIYKL